MSNISSIKQANAPEDHEGLWQEILRNPQVMIWMSNPQMQFVNATQPGLEFYGISLEELWVADWKNYIHPEDLGQVQQYYALALMEHPVIKQEYRAKKHTGEYAWLLDISYPRFAPSGEFTGYVGSIVDITEQIIREKSLKEEIAKISEWEQNRIGEDLHDGLAQVVLGISLKAMIMENKLKRRDLPEFLVAQEIANESSRVLGSLRKLSQALFPAELSQQEFCGSLRNLVESHSQEHGIKMTLNVDPAAVPPVPEQALLLFRIAQEAVTNAVRHGRANRIHVSLRIGYPGSNVLEVADDGIGISGDPRAAGGLGLRLIDYRAGILGAEIEIGRSRKGGTVLKCYFRSQDQ